MVIGDMTAVKYELN